MVVSAIMYKNLGVSNAEIAFYTSWLNLPWVIKPLWSPVVDLLKTRRSWIWVMQLVVGAGLAGVALTIPVEAFFQWTLVFFFLIAFSSATHDIAADGFYMLALTENRQAFFVGIRNTFYRVANITGQGLLVVFAGMVQRHTGDTVFAWSMAFAAMALLLVCFGVYHLLILPRPVMDQPGVTKSTAQFLREFGDTFAAFFRKPGIVPILLFLLLYRFAEAQLSKVAQLFLLESRDAGGLGLSTEQVGFLYGVVGVIALLSGGVLGGVAASRQGLRFWLWPMALAINAPNLAYVYLAWARPESLTVIGSCVVVELFGYGFGFSAYMLYMLYVARGRHQTAHYALCTGFMALGMMLPGMWSGALQEKIGYGQFFLWVMAATIPSFVVVKLIPLEAGFGKKG